MCYAGTLNHLGPLNSICVSVFAHVKNPKIFGILILQITSFLVLEEAPPILLVAIGLDNGCIYCIQGDIARERIKRFSLQTDLNNPDKSQCSITGMGFRVDGQVLQLFAVSPSSVSLFNLHTQQPRAQILDHIGSSAACVAMSDRLVCYC